MSESPLRGITTAPGFMDAMAAGILANRETVIRASRMMLHRFHAQTVARRIVWGSLPWYRRLLVERPS